MAKLPSLITNETTGEAISYYNGQSSNHNVQFRQVFEVTQNNNYTWTVKSSLYLRLNPNYPSGRGERFPYGVWQRLGDEYFKMGQDIQLLSRSGHWINGVQVSNNAYQYYKVMESTKTYNCSNTGRYGTRLDCGFMNSETSYYRNTDYTLIYVTLPAFSGLSYKTNNSWKYAMPWIKVNGEWKRAKQYIKINGQWKEYKDTWIWNPES
jgi:hypothetical protein